MSQILQFDAATLRRYDKPGPRYTSYPTAPHFGLQFTEAMLREHVQRTNDTLAGDGLVTITNRSITATARGRLLLRVIAMCFDRYLDAAPLPATRPQFSRVI